MGKILGGCLKHDPLRMSDVIRDFKKSTSEKVVDAIQAIPESSREWLMDKFEISAHSTGRAEHYKLWQDSSHPICPEGNAEWFRQRIDYTHQNPVRQLIVAKAEDYLYSSECDYAGIQGSVKVTVAF